jgi:hypothetical protein
MLAGVDYSVKIEKIGCIPYSFGLFTPFTISISREESNLATGTRFARH